MSLRRIALRYMSHFRCVGPECPDSCCHGWKVPVDQGHYARLKRAEDGPAERERFARVVQLLPPAERDTARFAVIHMAEDGGDCPFLDGDRLCSIQRRHGEDLLPDACSIFPRHVNRVGGRLELTGALSCPEIARLALLPEDATDLIEAPATLFGRGVEHNDMSTAGVAGFARHIDEIRGAMYELVSRRDEPLAQRLYLATVLAERTAPLFQQQPFDQGALEAAIDQMARPEVRAALGQALAEARPSLARGLEVIVGLLAARFDTPVHRTLAAVVGQVLGSYAAEAGAGIATAPTGEGLQVDAGLLAAAYARRRAAVAAAFGDIIERACYNFCRHYWIKEWYVLSGSLRVHAIGLLAQVALQRFLLLSHPEALAMATRGDGAAFEVLVVRVFYSFARSTGHNPLFATLCRERLAQQLPHLADALCLLAL